MAEMTGIRTGDFVQMGDGMIWEVLDLWMEQGEPMVSLDLQIEGLDGEGFSAGTEDILVSELEQDPDVELITKDMMESMAGGADPVYPEFDWDGTRFQPLDD